MTGLPYVTVAAVVLAAFDLVQRGVREVQFLSAVIYGQAVWSFDVAADDHQHVGSIQRGPHDAGSLLVPVGPEHETAEETKENISITTCGGSSETCLTNKFVVD